MNLGVCYYPEHWPAERWPIDARLFKEAGLSVVRMGEFAWAKMEPAEGRFDWAWLDQAIDAFASEGFKIMLGTPTAGPPAWLSRGYPETLPVDEQGRRRHFGGRRHYCLNSTEYQRHPRRIVQALAERYGQRPEVIGWQIDNEFGESDSARCFCPTCTAAFRRWLQERYATLESLNRAWGAVFWSQSYTEWTQIEPPVLTMNAPNPSHVLDYYRFASDSTVAYQQLQIEVLRAYSRPGQFITHNFMGLFSDLDYFKLAAPLDFIAWDSYPTGYSERWGEMLYGSGHLPASYAWDAGDPLVIGFAHEVMRGLLDRPFWITEQQAGNINWGQYNPGIRPGTVRLWTWHAAAAGAENVLYFRERACPYAQEQYHSGLLKHDGSPDLGYFEAQRLAGEQGLLDRITAQPFEAEVALVLNYEDLWALQVQTHRQDFGYLRLLFIYYAALQRLGVPVKVVPQGAPLDGFRVVLVPTALIGDDAFDASLYAYSRNGGTALLGVRSGFKTSSSQAITHPLPGVFRQLAGATVNQWQSLPPQVGYSIQTEIPGLIGEAMVWAEALSLSPDSKGLARYTSGPLAGQAALTEHPTGLGQALYLGWYPTPGQAQALLAYLCRQAGIEPLAELPPGLVAYRRGPFTILLNFTDQPLIAQIGDQHVAVGPRDVQVIEGDLSFSPAQTVL